jgi:hypothetical protein
MSEADAKLGKKARELVRALNDFAALLSIQAPTEMLVGQVEKLNDAVGEVLEMCPEEWWHKSSDWTDPLVQNQARLIEIVLAMQSKSDR